MAAVIELTGLTKRYGATVGIQELDLRVEAGEVFGFLGPNGAGKTTTIRCLVGLLSPTDGTARVLGLDPIADHARLTPQIGYLPGELRLYGELTGTQHLALLGALQGRPTPRREELCQRLELTGRDLDRQVAEYSHGMRQKAGLVQALRHDPEVVILDEPTEGLDPLVQETFVSVGLNVAHAPERLSAQLFAALPPVVLLGALELLMSVARTGLPHTSRIPASTQPALDTAGVALNRTPSGNGHRHPAALASHLPQDRTTDADPDTAAAPDARSRVRALIARERAGGPTVTAAEVIAVTGRSRRRVYELLRDARTEEG